MSVKHANSKNPKSDNEKYHFVGGKEPLASMATAKKFLSLFKYDYPQNAANMKIIRRVHDGLSYYYIVVEKSKINPYRSTAQRGKFHAMGERGEIKRTVKEFDRESKGLRLPKHVNGKTFEQQVLEARKKIRNFRRGTHGTMVKNLITEQEAALRYYGYSQAVINAAFQAEDKPKRNATASDFKQHQKQKLNDLSKTFQGRANGEKNRVLESDYTPSKKYRLGKLVQLKIKDGGKVIPIDFDGESYLAGDLKNNLWVVGKDARIENVKLPPKGQLKYLGELVQVDYITAKSHIENGKTVRYYHRLGEVTKEMPNLFVDDEGWPIIVAGAYDVWNVGVVN